MKRPIVLLPLLASPPLVSVSQFLVTNPKVEKNAKKSGQGKGSKPKRPTVEQPTLSPSDHRMGCAR